jgi:two-component system phosphate regulon sensor histidine kinase PhoR
MNQSNRGLLLLGAMACVTLACGAALLADLATGGLAMPAKIAAALGGLAVAAASIALAFRRTRMHGGSSERYLDELLEIQPQQYCSDMEQLLPQVDPSIAGGAPLMRLREHLVALAGIYQQAEQDRARAEVRYRRTAAQCEQLNDILQNLNEPVLAIDPFEEVVLANESAGELFAFDAKNSERRAVQSLVRCEQLLDLLAETRRRRGASQRAADLELCDEQGDKRYFNATVSTMASKQEAGNGHGQPHSAVIVLRDIGEQKAIQRRHAEFVAAVSHEMKTPLASIKAYVELLADGDAEDDQTREEFLEVINSQAERLRRLIDNLLNLARIEAGVVSVNKEKQSLNEVLEEAARVVQPAAEQKNIRLTTDLSPLYLGVLIDRDMLLQAAINLLSNGVKYTPAGGAVTLRSREIDGQAAFEVIDTGVGLSPEDCEKVFEKFYRVKKDQQMASGTGLGLPLVKHIVEEVHRGQITLESTLGQGSTFRVTLPNVRTADFQLAEASA